jgi:hypothetical protein
MSILLFHSAKRREIDFDRELLAFVKASNKSGIKVRGIDIGK